MKKSVSLIISIILIISLCGCSIKETIGNTVDSVLDFADSLFPVQSISQEEYELYDISQPDLTSCYNTLSENQKTIYKKIGVMAEKMTEGYIKLCKVKQTAISDIAIAYDAFLKDRADIFWMPDTYIIASTGKGNNKMYAIAFEYSDGKNSNHYPVKKEKRDQMVAQLDSVINEITQKAKEFSTQYEKEKYINDYLCNNVTYDKSDLYSNTVYGALVRKTALCEGYSKAFKLLCNKVGIQCDLVSGVAEGENHMWNLVNIDGAFSYVDVTWNDGEDYITYSYFNITDQQLSHDHTSAPLVSDLPLDDARKGLYNFVSYSCTYTGNTYFAKENLVFQGSYVTTAVKGIKAAQQKGQSYQQFLFSDDKLQNKFTQNPDGFLGKIQILLLDKKLTYYSLNRDTLTIFFE